MNFYNKDQIILDPLEMAGPAHQGDVWRYVSDDPTWLRPIRHVVDSLTTHLRSIITHRYSKNGLQGLLLEKGIPIGEATCLTQGLKDGGSLVVVSVEDTQASIAQRILDKNPR